MNKETKYNQQATRPEWWADNDSDTIRIAVTSGSSPFNEWYQFANRKEALDFIRETFNSQSYIDQFTWADDGELYHTDDVVWSEDGESNAPKTNAEPAALLCICSAESRF